MTAFPPIAELLPHASPMLLIDAVAAATDHSVHIQLLVRPGISFFTAPHGVAAHVGLEYMAQTCGAYAGLQSRAMAEPIRMGFLLGTRNFHAAVDWFAPGSLLDIHASKVLQQESLGVFDCTILCAGETLATAQLTVYQSDTIMGNT